MKAVLFDLDGTLLPVDNEHFIENYLKLLSRKIDPYIEPSVFIPQLLASTAAMLGNDDGLKTNEEIFIEDFFRKVEVPKEVLLPLFTDFYVNEYKKLGNIIKPTPISGEIIEILTKKGYRLVLATNPLFPKIAIEERLRWVDIDSNKFELITAYENMHFCKPNTKYYEEILTEINLPTEECLMVGNDVQEDMVTATLGMRTFLLTDFLIDRGEPRYQVENRGTLAEFKQFITDKL